MTVGNPTAVVTVTSSLTVAVLLPWLLALLGSG